MLVIRHVQTKTEIKAILTRYGIRPRKRLGQHFLIDGNLMRRLASSAELNHNDTVLEIGPGTGGLTDLLLAEAKRVIAVEVDSIMQTILRERFSGNDRFELIGADALARRSRLNRELLNTLAALSPTDREHFKLVANLPYQAAAPVLVNLLLCDTPPVRYCFTVQKEMADRFTASPRTRDYGPVAIAFQALCEIRTLAAVPRSAFWPTPQVESTILVIVPSSDPLYAGCSPARFMELARAGFVSRRKTLRFNLHKYLGAELVSELPPQLNLERRAEELSVAEWVHLDSLIAPRQGV